MYLVVGLSPENAKTLLGLPQLERVKSEFQDEMSRDSRALLNIVRVLQAIQGSEPYDKCCFFPVMFFSSATRQSEVHSFLEQLYKDSGTYGSDVSSVLTEIQRHLFKIHPSPIKGYECVKIAKIHKDFLDISVTAQLKSEQAMKIGKRSMEEQLEKHAATLFCSMLKDNISAGEEGEKWIVQFSLTGFGLKQAIDRYRRSRVKILFMMLGGESNSFHEQDTKVLRLIGDAVMSSSKRPAPQPLPAPPAEDNSSSCCIS